MAAPSNSTSASKDKGVAITPLSFPTTGEDQKPYSHNLSGHPALKLSNTIEKLKPLGPESNYLEWSWILNMHFTTTGVSYIIDPAIPQPQTAPTYAHDNRAICSVLAQTIDPANIQYIWQFHKDARKIWDGLRSAHQDSSSGGVVVFQI
jgi:hypothetical protein